MLFSSRKIAALNKEFRYASPESILNWALGVDQHVVATTHFGPNESVLLHHLSLAASRIPVIWVDHGYNMPSTYQVAEQLIKAFKLNVHSYTPRISAARRDSVLGGIPHISEAARHREFVEEVKIEPFQRAFKEWQPKIWLTSIRKEQTEHRSNLDIVTEDTRFNCVKVAPFFYWQEREMEAYAREHALPASEHYFDPTKVLENRECGLHLEG